MLRSETKKYKNKNMNLYTFKEWKFENSFVDHKLSYGHRVPSLYSFSWIVSLSPILVTNEIFGFQRNENNNFRALQFQNYENLNDNFLNNLSINYLYAFSDLKKISSDNFKYKQVFNSDDFYVYKKEDSLPYYYMPKKVKSNEGQKILDIKINSNEAYLEKIDFENIKKTQFGPATIEINGIGTDLIKINYNSRYSNILVISDLYDNNWKIKEITENKIYKVNFLFKGILLKPGEYQVTIYYDYKKFLYGIPISIFSIFIICYFFRKQQMFDNSNPKKKYYSQ